MRPVVRALTALSAVALSAAAAAQTPQPPTHKHYDRPAGYDQAPAPGMPLAPRLQNLGVHTFPVKKDAEAAQIEARFTTAWPQADARTVSLARR